MADSSSSLSRQWEAPATATAALGVSERLFALAKAASQDNVQPQALIALEKLGLRCLVSKELIGQGIDALNGNENIRLRDTKLLFGLAKGGVVAELRKSTSCIQGFLLVTALKLCDYEDTAVGQILFEMLCKSGDLSSTPVSERQLHTMVSVVSGHCQGFLAGSGLDAIDSVIQAIEKIKTTNSATPISTLSGHFWLKPSARGLAELLVDTLDAFRDEEVENVELIGSKSLVWICVILCWLNRENVALFHGETCFMGGQKSKIKVILNDNKPSADQGAEGSEMNQNWMVRTWKQGSPLLSLVHLGDNGDLSLKSISRGKIPGRAIRQYYLDVYGSESFVDVLGKMAETLVRAAFAFGRVCESEKGDAQELDSFLLHTSFRLQESIVKPFGWTSVTPSSTTLEPKDQIKYLRFIRRMTALDFISGAENAIGRVATGDGSEFDGEVFIDYVWSQSKGSSPEWDEISILLGSCVLQLATHALVLSFMQYPFSSLDEDSAELASGKVSYDPHRDVRECGLFLSQIFGLRSVLTPNDMIDWILHYVTGRSQRHLRETLAVVSGGCTFILAPVLDHSTEMEGIMNILIIPGGIYFEGERYERLLEEADRYSEIDIQTISPKVANKSALFFGPKVDEPMMEPGSTSSLPSIKMSLEHDPWRLNYSFLKDQDSLIMRSSLTLSQPKRCKSVLYRPCINAIGLALRIPRLASASSAFSLKTILGILEREEGRSPPLSWSAQGSPPEPNDAFWIDVLRIFDSVDRSESTLARPRICIIKPQENREVRFFSCQPRKFTNRVVIQMDASIDEVLSQLKRIIFSTARDEFLQVITNPNHYQG